MSTPLSIVADPAPKRIILRIRPNPNTPYECNKYMEYVETFLLRCGRLEPGGNYTHRHRDHIQPSSTTEPWHIIIDMEKHKFSGTDFDQLPHEIYRVERRETGIHFQLRDPVKYARYYTIARQYSDRYPWGSQWGMEKPMGNAS
ncbi:MAG: hypothetical protein M1840_001940 [Geoglossum simile]|nr:MAG: hypothetical protein M1840_001940 [Geoglossum simile]